MPVKKGPQSSHDAKVSILGTKIIPSTKETAPIGHLRELRGVITLNIVFLKV